MDEQLDWGGDVWGDVESANPIKSHITDLEPSFSRENSESVFDSQKDLVETSQLQESFSQLLTPLPTLQLSAFHSGQEKSHVSVDEGVWDPLNEMPSDVPTHTPSAPLVHSIQDTFTPSIALHYPVIPPKHDIFAPTSPQEKAEPVLNDPLGALVDPSAGRLTLEEKERSNVYTP